jgi:catecholate siderophore receptor
VNLVSKVPIAESFANGNASYGTANNGRLAADVNHALSESTAVRLNVMGQDGEVDGRDFIERQGWAVAPSLALGLDGATRAYFYLLHTQQDNTPDGGVPTIGLEGFYNLAFDTGGAHAGETPARVNRDNWYGLASDFEDIKATMFTARFEHDFNDHVTLRNTSRYGKLHQFYVLTGVNALTVTSPDPAEWTVARTRQAKFQDNTLLTNQTNITGGAWTVASGMTERYDASGDITVDTLAQAAAGSSGNKSATCAGSGRSISWLGAIASTSGGGATFVRPTILAPTGAVMRAGSW